MKNFVFVDRHQSLRLRMELNESREVRFAQESKFYVKISLHKLIVFIEAFYIIFVFMQSLSKLSSSYSWKKIHSSNFTLLAPFAVVLF